MQDHLTELELLLVGSGIQNILDELEVIPADQIERIVANAVGDKSRYHQLTVIEDRNVIFTSEDEKYEKNGASETLRLLFTLNRIGALKIARINEVELNVLKKRTALYA